MKVNPDVKPRRNASFRTVAIEGFPPEKSVICVTGNLRWSTNIRGFQKLSTLNVVCGQDRTTSRKRPSNPRRFQKKRQISLPVLMSISPPRFCPKFAVSEPFLHEQNRRAAAIRRWHSGSVTVDADGFSSAFETLFEFHQTSSICLFEDQFVFTLQPPNGLQSELSRQTKLCG